MEGGCERVGRQGQWLPVEIATAEYVIPPSPVWDDQWIVRGAVSVPDYDSRRTFDHVDHGTVYLWCAPEAVRVLNPITVGM